MEETKYVRNGCNIVSVAKRPNGTPVETFSHDSISQAKRKSRQLQMEHDGALGLGSVMIG